MRAAARRLPDSLRWAALAVAALAAWRIAAVNLSDFFVRGEGGGEIASALVWDPRNPQALHERGIADAAKGDARAADELAAALRANPADGRGYSVLARVKEAQGDVAAAERLMTAAVAMAPRRVDVNMEAAGFWMRRGDVTRGMRHWNAVLTHGAEYRAKAFPEILNLAETSPGLEALAELLRGEVAWWPEFISYVAASPERARLDTVQALFAMARGANAPNEAAMRSYLRRLQLGGLWIEAYFTWLNGMPREQVNSVGNVFNGGFEHPLSNSGFDWISDPVAQVHVEAVPAIGGTGTRSLHVVFSAPKTPYRHLRQYLLLPPGRYSLRGRVRPDGLEAAQGLQWSVQCVDGKGPLGVSERFIGTEQWRHFAFQFSIPENCPAQELRLELTGRASLDFAARGGVWFDDMQVERQQAD